jgi:hypothetical protein
MMRRTVPVTVRGHLHLAAERERDARAGPGALHLRHRLRVEDGECGDVFQSGIENAAKYRHGVHGAAGGAVVVVIEQHHRSVAHFLCPQQGFLQRLDLVDELPPRVPGQVEQFIAQRARLGRIAVGHHHGGRARVRNVRVRKADKECRRQRALAFHVLRSCLDFLVWRIQT